MPPSFFYPQLASECHERERPRSEAHVQRKLERTDENLVRINDKIAELELVMAHSEPTRAQQSLLTYLKEDCMVYETLAYILSVPEEEFESVVNEVGPAMVYEPTPVPRSVMDSYRRGLSDLEMKMEDRACGYADDLLGILHGDCTNY